MDDLNRGIERFNAGRFEEALLCFRAAVAAGRGTAQARVFTGHAYAGLAKFLLSRAPARDLSAEKALLGILTLKPSPGLRDALRACGRTFHAVGELDAAEKALSRASAPADLIKVLLNRGEEKDLRRALILVPGQAQARRLVLLLQRRAGVHLRGPSRCGRRCAAACFSRRAGESRRLLEEDIGHARALSRARGANAPPARGGARPAPLRAEASPHEPGPAKRSHAAARDRRAWGQDQPRADARSGEKACAWPCPVAEG